MFTDTSSAPKVYLEYEPSRPEGLTYIARDTDVPQARFRQVTTTRYEFRGLTRAAADSIAAAKVDTNTTAKAERMGQPDMWRVAIVTQTTTSWV